VLVDGLNKAGWAVPKPPASMFAWAPLPERFRPIGSLAFSKLLLEEAEVAVSPGVGFGEYGEGFVRLALVENKHRLRQAVRNVRTFLQRHGNGPRMRRRTRESAARNASWRWSEADAGVGDTLLVPPLPRCGRGGMSAVPLRVGVAGLGTVGGGTLRLLRANADLIEARAGRPVAVTAVSAKDPGKRREGSTWRACAGTATRGRWPRTPRSTSSAS
jgi:hypothetical protein